jgi:HK97 family phage prohead protease
MMNKTLDFSLEIKSVDEKGEGTFSGYASPFGGPPDSYGDIVEPGAYAASLATHRRKGTKPVMLWSHDANEPIGVWTEFVEDGKGLWGEGRLLKGIRRADETYILLKEKAINGLSIGYRVIEGEPDGPIFRLKKIDLIEVSVVAFPAAQTARVDTIKSEYFAVLRNKLLAGEPPTDREWERGLREAFELSRSEATAAVARCFKGRGQRESVHEETDQSALAAVAMLRDAIKGLSLRT